ncbi:MAG TPA: hypothetical protein VFT43_15310 [Candidatus Polarisedimenticolia bacterium]|nr:hypothetical protein [Candidatus Polarisedimenticolia bacterium]
MSPARRPGGARRVALMAIACLLLAMAVQGRIEARAAASAGSAPLLYLPSGRYLHFAALGFDALLADTIYLWSIQYYGNYQIADRYLYLEQIYGQVIAELDPRYLDPYLTGALIMTTEARRPEMALRLLDKGIEHNPQVWILPFEAGFICYDDLRDYQRAAAYFEAALKVPGVPPLVRRFYAEMFNRAGDKRTSLKEWDEIYRTAGDDYVRGVAWNHVHDLTIAVDLADLRAALDLYRARQGKAPRRLQDLAEAGAIGKVPQDPEGRDYLYDPRSGEISYHALPVVAR